MLLFPGNKSAKGERDCSWDVVERGIECISDIKQYFRSVVRVKLEMDVILKAMAAA